MRLFFHGGLAALLLAACAAAPRLTPPALPEGQVRWFQAERLDGDGVAQTALLSVQGESGGRTRWLLADAFGAPQARLLLSAQGWRSDGFAPPNAAARQLFDAMLPQLPHGFRQPTTLHTPNHLWRISPLEQP